jgi:hypothetical protein
MMLNLDDLRVSSAANAERYLRTPRWRITTRKRAVMTSLRNQLRRYAARAISFHHHQEMTIQPRPPAYPVDQTAHGGRKEGEARRAENPHGGETCKKGR